MIVLGTPRVVASLLKAPAFHTLRLAHADRPISLEKLEEAINFLELATAWEQSGQLYGDLGFLLYLDASQRSADDPLRQLRAAESIAAIEHSLARAPVVPQGWLRLAYAKSLTEGPSPEVARYLEQSLRLAPFLGALALARIDLLLRNWPYLNAEVRQQVGPQIRYAWRHHSRSLVEIASASGHLQVLRLALRSVPDANRRIDQILARLAAS